MNNKDLITPDDVRSLAVSPEGALDVSIDVWRQRCEMSEEDAKSYPYWSYCCGLCCYYRYIGCMHNGKLCPLAKSEILSRVGCCEEYDLANGARSKWLMNIASFSFVKSAFYTMLDRLEREKDKLPKQKNEEREKELKHGDYGFWIGSNDPIDNEYIHLATKDGIIRPAGTKMYYKCQTSNPKYYRKVGNIFDELSIMTENMENYKIGNAVISTSDYPLIRVEIGSSVRWFCQADALKFFRAGLVICANAKYRWEKGLPK